MSEILFETLERVRSFKILKWNYRCPSLFHPYSLALRGYRCSSYDVIECHICKNTVQFYSEEHQEQIELDQGDLTQKIDAHHKDCLYNNLEPASYNFKKIFSPNKIYLLMDEISDLMKKSYQQRKEVKLPVIDDKKFWEILKKDEKADMMKVVIKRCQMEIEHYNIDFILRLFGWTIPSAVEDQPAEELECLFCGGTTLINEYFTVTNNRQPHMKEEEEHILFNPAEEHRYFCIWNQDLKGWLLWLQHLWDKMDEARQIFRKQNPETVQKIRLHLDKYLEKFCATTRQEFQKINKILEQSKKITQELQESKQKPIDYKRNYEEMCDFLETLENGIKVPLKKLKID